MPRNKTRDTSLRRIIELAAVCVYVYFNPNNFRHTLLNSDGKAIKSSYIHGITNDMVATAPRFSNVYGSLGPVPVRSCKGENTKPPVAGRVPISN